jgi:hypothetical protein
MVACRLWFETSRMIDPHTPFHTESGTQNPKNGPQASKKQTDGDRAETGEGIPPFF